MFESVTLVRVRKDTKITVPAGGWLLLANPNQPMSEHVALRAKLVREGNVNDEYERLVIGRVQDTHTPTRFVTTDESKAAIKRQEATAKSLATSHTDALARQKQQSADAIKASEADHKSKVAELSAEHDKIRTRPLA